MRCNIYSLFVLTFFFAAPCFSQEPPEGFRNAEWSMPPQRVREVNEAASWIEMNEGNSFPEALNISVYGSNENVAGYPALIKYYFFENKFFQATIVFDFNELKTYDFNYNVYISVNKYYKHIRSQSLTFVSDIYDLLKKKYGKKEPVFKGLDPRYTFRKIDEYINQNVWNLRYHPYEYYKNIISSSYARWDFPKTRVIFSMNVSASDKRFDYQLSLTSLDLEKSINEKKDAIRSSGL